MRINPVREDQATPETRRIYDAIKEALHLPHTPLFFQFLGGFPEYLEYISGGIIANLSDSRFNAVIQTRNEFVRDIFKEDFDRGKDVVDFLQRYKNTPEFYYFEKDVQSLYAVNASLAFIFISLREAVKGWAVAARKLAAKVESRKSKVESEGEKMEEELVYGIDIITDHGSRIADQVEFSGKDEERSDERRGLTVKTQGLIKREGSQISVALLPEYLRLCRNEFSELLKAQQLLFLRVELERVVLRSIDTLPYKIESPINVVLELTKMYPTFPDLLYLLSEHFPTYAMQRWLFSAYLLP
ncbi:MAG: hypothetical protein WC775_05165 [Patescibacteria group bacterium]|jgi:hypothetical protein